MEFENLCPPQVLRRLDYNENSSIKYKDLSNFTKLIRIESQIDYYQHLDLFKSAIQKWISMHPFLSAKIQHIPPSNYFVYDKNIDFMRDVYFYCIETNNLEHYNELIQLLLESETLHKLKHTEKLWRLKLVKLIDSSSLSSLKKYDYDFIFTIHHSITEGRNAYFVLLQLIDVFESLFKKLNTYDCVKQLSILPSMEDLFLRNASNVLSSTSFVSGFKKPNFVNLEKSPEPYYSVEKLLKKYSNVKIYSLDNDKNETNLVSIRDLINDANQNESKFKFLTIESNYLNKLIKKLKLEKLKMQSFLNMLFSFAFHKVYKEKGSVKDHDHSVVYGYAVNLRKYSINPEMFGDNLNENMGVSTNVFVSYLKENADFTQDYRELFWSCVKSENEEMLNRFQIDEHFKIPNVLGSFGELRFDLVLSNIGIMEASYSKDSSLHFVKSCYFTGVNEFANKIGFCYFITVNDKLCWSFLYNSFVIDDYIANYIVDNVKEIFSLVISND